MSVIRPRPPADPILFLAGPVDRGEGRDAWVACRRGPLLEPLLEQPARLLADYRLERPTSELYAVLQAARRIRDTSDRVIVVADAGSSAAARAILATCCHPYHAELPRGERGGRPRIAFTGDRFANDRDQGLLDLVAPVGRPLADDLLERWSLVVVAGRTVPATVAASARLFLRSLADGMAGDVTAIGERVATVGSGLAPLATALGIPGPFTAPDRLAGPAGVFTAAALLPAAIAGVDVVRLLEGAVAMNMRLDEAPLDDHPLAGLLTVWRPRAAGGRVWHRLLTDDERLESVSDWFDALEPPSVDDPRSVATTRLVAVEPRRDPLTVPPPHAAMPAGDGLPVDDLVGASWPDLAAGATVDNRASAVRLPRVDEHSIGQTLQMLLLAHRIVRRDAGT